jgi:hypothetical protein
MDLTIDTAKMSPMLGRLDVYRALLDAMKERRGDNESAPILKMRLQRALQSSALTVRLSNSQARVPAEIAFIGKTVAEVHPSPVVLRSSQA